MRDQGQQRGALQQFEFEGTLLRTVEIDGEPWFVAKDVATVLGYRSASDMTRTLGEDAKGTHQVETLGGAQSLGVISEPALYHVVLQRQDGWVKAPELRDQVKRFQRWVTHEVLPQIRQTGSYVAAPMSEDEIVHQALQITAAKVQALESRVAELAPSAQFADTVLSAQGDMTVGDAAKALANAGVVVGQNRLFSQLHVLGWIYRSPKDKAWRPVQARVEAGHLSVLPQSHYHPKTGELVMDPPQVRVTAKGLQLLAQRLAGRAVAAQLHIEEAV